MAAFLPQVLYFTGLVLLRWKDFHLVVSSKEMVAVLSACHFIYNRLHFSSR